MLALMISNGSWTDFQMSTLATTLTLTRCLNGTVKINAVHRNVNASVDTDAPLVITTSTFFFILSLVLTGTKCIMNYLGPFFILINGTYFSFAFFFHLHFESFLFRPVYLSILLGAVASVVGEIIV